MMKAAVFHGKGDVRIESRPVPVPKKGEVLIKVKACGVCGTDVHIFSGDKGCAETTPPVILGHEIAGVVERIGDGADNVSVGDRVCVDPNVLCGKCRYCTEALGHFCENMTGIGTTTDGGFAEYVSVPAKQVFKLSDDVSFEEGAMTEPVACCLHGIDMCGIRPGDDFAVVGGGMIGLIMLQLALKAGAARAAIVEPVEKKRNDAKKLGAFLTLDPFSCDVKSEIERAGIRRLSCVIECAGLTSTIAQAIAIAGKASVVMMFGLTAPDAEVAIKPFEIFQKEITLRSSFINPYTQRRALGLINSRAVDVKSPVAETVPLEELPSVLADAKRRSRGKIIVRP